MNEVSDDEAQLSERGHEFNWWLLCLLGAIFLVGLVVIGYKQNHKTIPPPPTDKYSAVFVDSGAIYFGKLNGYTLSDVHYLKDFPATSSTPAQLGVIKLTDEMHKPTGDLILTPSHIVQIEPLADDSPVVKQITGK